MDYRSIQKLMSESSTQASTIDIKSMLDMNTRGQQQFFDTVDTSKFPKEEDHMMKYSGMTGHTASAKTNSDPGHTS